MDPAKLTDRHQQTLARVQEINKDLYRAYLIYQQLRMIYRVPCEQALKLLEAWLKWARRCRLRPFIRLANTITNQRAGIEAALRHRLSNARAEQANTQIRLITQRGFGLPLTLGRDRTRDALTRRTVSTTTRPLTRPTVHAGDPLFGPPDENPRHLVVFALNPLALTHV